MEKMISTEMVTAQNSNNNQSTKIDFTEFVRELGKQYGEMNYEAAETPEDLQSTIDWADTNFYESDSLNWMLGENSEYSEIASIFDEMEWDEYKSYERIFVDAAIESMEKCLQDWTSQIQDEKFFKANDIQAEYQAQMEELAENRKYSEVPLDEDFVTLQKIQEIYDRYLDAICDLYGCECGVGDGFGLDLSCFGDEFPFETPDCQGWELWECQYDRLDQMVADLEYKIAY